MSNSPPNTDYNDDYSICDDLAAITSTKSLSKMSDEQASELKRLETEYDAVLDENCRILANYFKEVLENEEENTLTSPPMITIMKNTEEPQGTVDEFDGMNEERRMRTVELLGISINGRYNVMLYFLFF